MNRGGSAARQELRYSTASDRRRIEGEREMAGIRIITVLYAIMFVVMVLVVIGSIFGVFDNPLIDPGL